MKFRYLLIAALAGLALVGCNKENGDPNTEVTQIGEKEFMAFSISMPAATKGATAGDPGTYEVGADYENWINTIHFFFYKDGTYVSWGYGDMSSKFVNPNSPEASTGDVEEILHDGTTAKEGIVVLQSTLVKPNQVLCVINSRGYEWYRNRPLAEVLDALHTGPGSVTEKGKGTHFNPDLTYQDFYYEDGKPYFVMFTAPMYGLPASGSTKHAKYVTDIDPDKHIKFSAAEAKKNPVTIYVERMAARIEVTNFDKGAAASTSWVDDQGFIKPEYFTEDMYVLGTKTNQRKDLLFDVKPVSWAITAVNKNSYSIKHVDDNWVNKLSTDGFWTTAPEKGYPFGTGEAGSATNWLLSGGEVENPLRTGDKMKTRINWAIDHNYGKPIDTNRESYPHSARELENMSELKYYSADEINAHFNETTAGNLNDILQRYCYENTLAHIGQQDPRISGTMLLFLAQARIHDETKPYPEASYPFEDLYYYMGQYYTEDDYIDHLLANANMGLKLFVNDGGITPREMQKSDLKRVMATQIDNYYNIEAEKNWAAYVDLKDALATGSTTDKLKDLYGTYTVDLSGTVNMGSLDAKFTAIPKPSYPLGDEEKGYADGYVTYVPTEATIAKLVVNNPAYTPGGAEPEYIAASAAQIAEAFLGKIIEPANRFENGLMYYAIPIEHFGDGKTTGTDPQYFLGNYGVVRNNLYRVTLGTMKGMGHGIDKPDEPIVPGDRRKPFYIAAKINILSWQLVTQTANDLAE